MRRIGYALIGAMGLGLWASAGLAATPGDFTIWTQVQDPANALMTGSTIATQAALNAGNGAVPAGTDIGYQTVNGTGVADSTQGFYFAKLQSVSLAVDFAVSGSNQQGTLGIGFGIGEDSGGMNSAGVAMVIQNGSPLAYGAAARVNDVNQPASILALGSSSGTLFVSYDASTGNVTVGESTTTGASSPAASATYSGIEQQWAGDDLLASFFLRSDGTLGTPWQGGTEQAVFSNFRVLSGTAEAVPEPGSLVLLLGGIALFARRRRASKGL